MGKSLLRNHSTEGKDVITAEPVLWLQKAFAIAEKLDNSRTPGLTELKVCARG